MESKVKRLSFWLFILVGMISFTFNTDPDMYPYLQIPITLFKAKLGIIIVYLLTMKLAKNKKSDYFKK